MAEHKDIVDPNIHETKGVAAAANGQVHAKQSGVGSWVNPYSLQTVRQTVVFEGATASNQVPASNDVAQTVTFGGAVAGTDINMDSGGTVTVNTTGFYKFQFNLNFGKTAAAGTSIFFVRAVVNGTPTGFVQGVKLGAEIESVPLQFGFERAFTAGDLVKLELYRDSAGNTDGGLIGITSTLAGWDDTNSAWLRISKMEGVGA